MGSVEDRGADEVRVGLDDGRMGAAVSRSAEKGAKFETMVVRYLQRVLGPAIERRVKHGTKDQGDVSGVYIDGMPVVLELKNRRKMELAEWIGEAETERGNADAEYGVVVHKRRGCGEAHVGDNYVTMTLETFAAIVAHGHEYLGIDGNER